MQLLHLSYKRFIDVWEYGDTFMRFIITLVTLFLFPISFFYYTEPAYALKHRLPLNKNDCLDNGCMVTGYYNHQHSERVDYSCKNYTYYTNTYTHSGTDFAIIPKNQRTSWEEMSLEHDVVASASGTVVAAIDGYYDTCNTGRCSGSGFGGATAYGNHIKILHEDGKYSYYAHLKKGSLQVKEGDSISCGQVLGFVGSSGNSQGPHLHFELRSAQDTGNADDIYPKSYDPYVGLCSTSIETSWTSQGEYLGLPAAECDGDANPIPFPARKNSQAQTIIHKAVFVSETIPDNSTFLPSTPFVKKFVFKNAGNSPWTREEGFYIEYEKGDNLSEFTRIDIPPEKSIKPGETVTLEIPMLSPSNVGNYTTYWIWKYQGVSFQPRVWTKIIVRNNESNAQNQKPSAYRNSFLKETISDGTWFEPGQTFIKTWTFKNTGSESWNSKQGLYFFSGNIMDASESYFHVEGIVDPMKEYTFSVPFIAPQNSGIFRGYWQMKDQFGKWFGKKVWVEIRVGEKSNASQITKFLVLGDSGTGGPKQYKVSNAMKTVCLSLGCDFALLLGDIIYDFGVTSANDPQFQTKFELPYANLWFPFYIVVGNHDAQGNLNAMVDYSMNSTKFRLPSLFYTFQEKNINFYALNSNSLGLDQANMLKETDNLSKSKWKIAYAHHPYKSNGLHGDAVNWQKTFFEQYLCNRIDIYFAGHDHDKEHLSKECGMRLFVSGAASSIRVITPKDNTLFAKSSYGFGWVKIEENTFTFKFFDENANEEYHYTDTK